MTTLCFLRNSRAQKVSDEIRLKRIEATRTAIAEVLNPELIFVFGSAAHGIHFDSDSDIDCLAVLDTTAHARRYWKKYGLIRRKLEWSLDLVCLSMEEFKAKREIGGVAMIAVTEGILIYSKEELARSRVQ